MSLPNFRTVICVPVILGATCLFSTMAIVFSLFDKKGRSIDFCAYHWGRTIAWITGMKITAHGRKNVNAAQSYMVVTNHQSHMDTIAIFCSCPVPTRMLAKASLFKIPIFGQALARAGHIKVNRGPGKKTDFSKLLSQVERLRKNGRSVVVFAEGTRSVSGEVAPFKLGAFHIAKQYDLPILPITIKDTKKVLPAKTLRFSSGAVHMVFHPPFMPGEKSAEELAVFVREKIAGAI